MVRARTHALKIFGPLRAPVPFTVTVHDVANQLAGAIPGAVGFMSASDVKPPLKILRVDNKLPGDPGYLIR